MTDVLAATITAVVAFAVGLLVNVQGRWQFFSSIVSGERMVWIKDIRALCTELCTICESYDANISEEKYREFLKARNGILVRLDPKGWYTTDDELIDLLIDPDFEKVKENLPRIREILMTILKTEWDKVKIEAGNSYWKVRKIEKMQEHIKSQQYHGDTES